MSWGWETEEKEKVLQQPNSAHEVIIIPHMFKPPKIKLIWETSSNDKNIVNGFLLFTAEKCDQIYWFMMTELKDLSYRKMYFAIFLVKCN